MTEGVRDMVNSALCIMLAVFYCLAGLAIIFPGSNPLAEPFASIGIGMLLLIIGMFGEPFPRIP